MKQAMCIEETAPHHGIVGNTTTSFRPSRPAVASSITNEAVDELAWKVGDSVSAVIRSSDVMIGK